VPGRSVHYIATFVENREDDFGALAASESRSRFVLRYPNRIEIDNDKWYASYVARQFARMINAESLASGNYRKVKD